MPETYSPETELQPGDIVGDDRRLRLYSVSPGTGDDCHVVGEVWQDGEGKLHGSGIAAVMLFEPVTVSRYLMASITSDMSPLSMFYARITRSPFLRAEVVNG